MEQGRRPPCPEDDEDREALMATFKTQLAGNQRTKVVAQGRAAAKAGLKRKSPHVNCRAEEAWYHGFDEHINNPSTLAHCTDCGTISNGDVDTCPSCTSTNIRHGVGIGTEIVMTVGG